MRPALIWLTVVLVITVPLIAAAASPLLAWRQPVYIAAGFAGIIGLALLLLQPLLVADTLPGIRGRRVHPWIGAALVLMVLVHVAGLWITSPPDVIDVLLFRSPTPFAIWGALAMWAAFAAALLALVRKRIGLRVWRMAHTAATTVIVIGTVAHAMLIEGAMEILSKSVLCLLVIAAFAWALLQRRVWRVLPQKSRK
ncbi:ferric reductase-like transmembrane domain-containing protein [Pontivivens ytuae]|uniref:Ferric reductase-like transmembrane domain-containing protein n=1 Tax=Pontivivens ytuae TaxID=2789856 RepID=A0A7S9QCI1_9RHOB|nr:ferric reductase-like transmembrane domain-containing protein [Pontivivens ytuae]QPH54243.1 ferric reductase-like transmembrane domain-containing protein [Pontivivens ytuae]